MKNEHKFPIRAVSQITGLSLHLIRAWESRYSAIIPARTETNRRLYSSDDIKKLQLLNRATKHGHNISSIASMTIEGLEEILSENQFSQNENGALVETKSASINSNGFLEECLACVQALDKLSLESTLLRASMELTRPVLFEQLIIPLLIKVGEYWHRGEFRVAHEHFVSGVLRTFIGNMLDSLQVSESAPKIIFTTPIGQLHELGALIASVYAATEGWNPIYLGPNLPVEEIASTVNKLNAKAIFLSIVYPADDPQLVKELTKIGVIIPKHVSIFAAGGSALGYKKVLESVNAIYVEDPESFRKQLEIVRSYKE